MTEDGGTTLSDREWTHRDDVNLAKFWCVDGLPVREIAFRTGRSKSAVFRRINALDLKGKQRDIETFEFRYGTGVDFPFSEIRVAYEQPKAKRRDGASVSIHWGDVHFPFQDDRAVEILYQITDELKPDTLVCHGDIYDFWELSTHRPPDEKKLSPWQLDLQAVMEESARHLGRMGTLAAPGAKKYFLGGNHEDRWDRTLNEMKKDRKVQHLLSLDAFNDTFYFEKVSGIESLDYEYIGYSDSDPLILNDKLVCIHGNHVTLWVTRKVLELYGKSVMLGHTHRIQNWTQRNLKGQEAGWNIGCMCDLNPHYMVMANWHQGFAVVDWTDDGMFDVQTVRIHNGKTIFRGKEYRA